MKYNYLSWLQMTFPVLGMISTTFAWAQETELQKKNVLLIVMDDLRTELNCYGVDYMHTPNLDAFAQEGVMFQNAYCNVAVSGASRASIFSGLRPAKKRFWDVKALIDKEAPGTITLPQHFRENGYITVSNSKIIHGENDAKERSWSEYWMPEGKSKTWRDYLGEENLATESVRRGPHAFECLDVQDNEYFDGKTVEKSLRDLKRLKKSGQPFFLAVGILKPHLPFNAPKKYWDLYDENDIELPETFHFDRTSLPEKAFHNFGEIRYYQEAPVQGDISAVEAKKLIHGYRACVSYADACVGKLLKGLKELNLDENTIVVLLGDHGWSLGDHSQWCKHSNFNIVNNTPLIIRLPGNKKKGVEQKVVEMIDIYPTVCEAAGLPIPSHVQGNSMLKLLQGEDPTWKDCAIIKWHTGLTYFNRDYGYTEWRDKTGKLVDHMLFLYKNDKIISVH